MGLILLKDMCFVFSLCLMLVRSSTFKLTDDLGQHYSGEYYLKYFVIFLYGCLLVIFFFFSSSNGEEQPNETGSLYTIYPCVIIG